MRHRMPQATYPGAVRAARLGRTQCPPIWSCSGRGLPCHSRCRERGALLPHHFTLTPQRAPERRPRMTPVPRGRTLRGGIFSVALSVGSRPPGVTWRPALWSPDFPPPAFGGQRLSGRLAASVSFRPRLRYLKSGRPDCRNQRSFSLSNRQVCRSVRRCSTPAGSM